MSRTESAATSRSEQYCAFCGYGLPRAPVRDESGRSYCTDRCRDAHRAGTDPFVGRHGYKQVATGVPVLDALLPAGIPANSFVLLAGEGGIRHRGLQTELLWRTLTRGEPVIVITFVDPPVAIVEHFLTFGWNVLPFLQSGDLRILDCFTTRLREEHQTPEHQVDWNDHLTGFLDDVVTVLHDTTDFRSIEDGLHSLLEELTMRGEGMVVLDSLDEAEIQGHESEIDQFIKEIRGDVCSRRFVPIFTSTTAGETRRTTADLAYLFDGIIEMRRDDSLVPDVPLKQLSVRKMDGVLYHPDWVTYEQTGGGFRIFDPQSDLATVYGPPPTAFGRR